MAKVSEYISALQSKEADLWLAGASTDDQIARIEDRLGIELPASYRTFLKEFGGLEINGMAVSGIIENNAHDESGGSVVGDTLELRTTQALPRSLLAISMHEDGAYCLDSSRPSESGEYPVVNFEHGSLQHQKPLAASFEEWLIKWILEPEVGSI